MNNFTCACPPGWEGRTCSVNINDCLFADCQNGGICMVRNIIMLCTYTCVYIYIYNYMCVCNDDHIDESKDK